MKKELEISLKIKGFKGGEEMGIVVNQPSNMEYHPDFVNKMKVLLNEMNKTMIDVLIKKG